MSHKEYLEKNCYLTSDFKNKILKYATGKDKPVKPWKAYTLPKDMLDSEIQKETGSEPMQVDDFISFAYHAITSKDMLDKKKYYIFHVKMDDGTVLAVDLNWYGDEWNFNAYTFVEQRGWFEGSVFVYFPATVSKTLKTKTLGNSDTLTLERAIGMVVMAGYKVTRE